MKRMVKKNYKIIIAFIIGLMISSIGVYALSSLSSSDVSYDNGDSKLQSTTMQGAIDELYTKANVQKKRMPKPDNENIVSSYFYNQVKGSDDFCVTGDEDTCKVNTCYLNKAKNSCEPGTIIEYNVKDGEKVRFHVVHDDGETMTLQSQKNTVYSTAWYTTGNETFDDSEEDYIRCTNCDNRQGPQTILPILEEKTNNWSNVNNLNYSIGDASTTLGYSYCNVPNSLCSYTRYSLTRNSVKARILTNQEAMEIGCTRSRISCPIWMYNYLRSSKDFGGTETDTNNAYWLLNTPNDLDRAWDIMDSGELTYTLITDKYGARAVVEINKN